MDYLYQGYDSQIITEGVIYNFIKTLEELNFNEYEIDHLICNVHKLDFFTRIMPFIPESLKEKEAGVMLIKSMLHAVNEHFEIYAGINV